MRPPTLVAFTRTANAGCVHLKASLSSVIMALAHLVPNISSSEGKKLVGIEGPATAFSGGAEWEVDMACRVNELVARAPKATARILVGYKELVCLNDISHASHRC